MISPSFIHVFEQGAPEASTLVLLHGTGGDEDSLIPIAKQILPEVNLLGLRGNVMENGAPRFFRRFAEGVLDIEDWRARTHEVADFVTASAKHYGFDLKKTYFFGYSNGANLMTGLLLLRPEVLAGALLLRPMFITEITAKSPLTGKPILIDYGIHDPFLKPGDIERLTKQFTSAGASVEVHAEEVGHGLGPGDFPVMKAWLEKVTR